MKLMQIRAVNDYNALIQIMFSCYIDFSSGVWISRWKSINHLHFSGYTVAGDSNQWDEATMLLFYANSSEVFEGL